MKKGDSPAGRAMPGGPSSDRCPVGVEGLDEILGGGLPRHCFYLVQGDPGAGKTTLALQFLLEGLRRGESALYITLSETRDELQRVAHSHGWSLDGISLLEMSAIGRLLPPEAQTTVFHPSEMELTEVSRLVMDETRKAQPARVVFDSLSEFRLLAETPLRYRRQLLNLKQEFARYHSTVLLLDDKMENARVGTDPHVMSLTDAIIEMEQSTPDYGSSRRRLRVSKLRGVKFREGYHDYTILTGGLRTFPRLVAAEHHTEFVRGPVSSGLKELDELLGGGLDRGTTTLLLGPAGTGKSTLALHYAARMAANGEHGLIFTFDESRGIMLARAAGLGINLEPHMCDGTISIQQVDPAELSPGEFATRVRTCVDSGAKLVVIDSLNGYLNAMPGEHYLLNQLHELNSYLNQLGIVTILVLAQQGLITPAEPPVELSYLADSIMTIRYFQSRGEIRQALAVVKKRSGYHEKEVREFRLETGKGIRIGEPLREFSHELTSAPEFSGNVEQLLKSSDAGK